MKTIAILLTVHNRKKETLNCLSHIFAQKLAEGYQWDVFLTDDRCTDGTPEAVKTKYPTVNIIPGDGNLFWNRGMHLAWETASKTMDYDYFLWLNDDTLLFEDSLNLMLDYSQSKENKKIIIGATCSEINGIATYSGFIHPDIRLTPNGTWQNCDFFNGNIVLIPSHVFKKVGILDKHFHHSLGDIDYGMRAAKLGFIHVLAPFCLGICESHISDPTWRNPKIPVYKRLKHLYSPLGNNPFECFIFERRHNGLKLAILRFFSNHLRAILPQLWN